MTKTKIKKKRIKKKEKLKSTLRVTVYLVVHKAFKSQKLGESLIFFRI